MLFLHHLLVGFEVPDQLFKSFVFHNKVIQLVFEIVDPLLQDCQGLGLSFVDPFAALIDRTFLLPQLLYLQLELVRLSLNAFEVFQRIYLLL